MEYLKAPPSKAAENLFFYAGANAKVSDVFKLLDDKEVDINCRNPNGTTALHMAGMHQGLNIVKILLEYDAEVDFQEEKFAGGKTPLYIAVQKNNYEIAKILLEYGSDPNIADCQKRTP